MRTLPVHLTPLESGAVISIGATCLLGLLSICVVAIAGIVHDRHRPRRPNHPHRRSIMSNPHVKPAIASGIGTAVGALVLVKTYFSTGHIPTPEEVAGVATGGSVVLGSVWKFIEAHSKITTQQLINDARVVTTDAKAIEPVAATVVASDPALEARLQAVEGQLVPLLQREGAKPIVQDLEAAGRAALSAVFGGKKIATDQGLVEIPAVASVPSVTAQIAAGIDQVNSTYGTGGSVPGSNSATETGTAGSVAATAQAAALPLAPGVPPLGPPTNDVPPLATPASDAAVTGQVA